MVAHKKVRSIGRGLDVLAAVNAEPGTSVSLISKTVGLHRTTVYRILETLEELGYVCRRVFDDSYHVTCRASCLGNNVVEGSAVLDAAAPHLRKLIDQIDWPTSIVMKDRNSMSIRETTHGRSKIYVHGAMVGTRVPMLTSAAGRAYLSFCSDAERSTIIDAIAISPFPDRRLAQTSGYIDRFITATLHKGYGVSMGDTWKWLGSIAMPVRQPDGEVVACMNVVFFTSAFTERAAVERYLPTLQQTVAGIEQQLVECRTRRPRWLDN